MTPKLMLSRQQDYNDLPSKSASTIIDLCAHEPWQKTTIVQDSIYTNLQTTEPSSIMLPRNMLTSPSTIDLISAKSTFNDISYQPLILF